MKFLNSLRKNKIKVGSSYGSTQFEIENFLCGIGESEINEKSIRIWNYPFEPASVYPEREIRFDVIDEIHKDQYPPTLKLNQELIFITRESLNQLTEFAYRNQIKLSKRVSNWNWITEPFLDMEASDKRKDQTAKILKENGISEKELLELREEIGHQMYKYNFDTMLWDWCNLGLADVLSAMRLKLDSKEFEDFYWRAMEIEQRNEKSASPNGV